MLKASSGHNVVCSASRRKCGQDVEMDVLSAHRQAIGPITPLQDQQAARAALVITWLESTDCAMQGLCISTTTDALRVIGGPGCNGPCGAPLRRCCNMHCSPTQRSARDVCTQRGHPDCSVIAVTSAACVCAGASGDRFEASGLDGSSVDYSEKGRLRGNGPLVM